MNTTKKKSHSTKTRTYAFALICLTAFALLATHLLYPAIATSDDLRQKELNGSKESSRYSSGDSDSRLVHVSTRLLVSASDSYVTRQYSGTVVAKRTSELGFKRIGRIIRLLVDQGDLIEEGQRICELDTAQLEAQIAILQAQRLAALARLAELKAGPRKQAIEIAKLQLTELSSMRDQLKSTYDRRSRLANSDAIAIQDIDDARHQLSAADARVAAQQQTVSELLEGTRKEQIEAQEAEVARLDASIDALNVEIEESHLRSPFRGIVAKRYVDEGTIVQPGQSIARLVEAVGLEAFIGLPVDIASQLVFDQRYTLRIGDSQYFAKLKAVLPELDSGTRTRTAIFSIETETHNGGKLGVPTLSPGQAIHLRLEQKVNGDGFWVPMSALTKNIGGLWSVYVIQVGCDIELDRSIYTVKRADVEVVQIDTSRVLIRGGVKEGDRIVMDGVQKITQGQKISFKDINDISDLSTLPVLNNQNSPQ